MKQVILASNSPRRKELLSLFGLPFEIHPADIIEDRKPGEPPADYVQRLACQKAAAVAAQHPGLVIAADTIVVNADELLGKPEDEEDARQMLLQLRGHTHQVYTGLALLDTESGQTFEDVTRTDVVMRHYSDAEIDAYIETGDPLDKAGAYAIQHAGFHPVDSLVGCYASVMGLPLCRLAVGLQEFGVAIPDDLAERGESLLNYACPILREIQATSENR